MSRFVATAAPRLTAYLKSRQPCVKGGRGGTSSRRHLNENNHGRIKVTQTRHKLLNGCTCCGPLVTLGRREFVAGGLAALGLGAFAASGIDARAQTQAKPHRIDVHHHISPPTWLDAVKNSQARQPAAGELVGAENARRHGQGRASRPRSTSPTTPQVTGLGTRRRPSASRAKSNEYAKKLETDHPGRFGTVRHAAAAARRREPQGDRLRLRHAQGRRRRLHDELRRQVAGLCRSSSRCGRSSTAARPRSTPIRPAPIAASTWCRASGIDGRVRHRYDPHHRQPDLQRHLAEATRTSTGSGRTAAAR